MTIVQVSWCNPERDIRRNYPGAFQGIAERFSAPMELTGWLRLLDASSGHEQRARVEQLVRECLQVSRIRTYHCTRLLASEVEAIKREGLRPPSADLARDKREAASAAGRPLLFW